METPLFNTYISYIPIFMIYVSPFEQRINFTNKTSFHRNQRDAFFGVVGWLVGWLVFVFRSPILFLCVDSSLGHVFSLWLGQCKMLESRLSYSVNLLFPLGF